MYSVFTALYTAGGESYKQKVHGLLENYLGGTQHENPIFEGPCLSTHSTKGYKGRGKPKNFSDFDGWGKIEHFVAVDDREDGWIPKENQIVCPEFKFWEKGMRGCVCCVCVKLIDFGEKTYA